MQEVDFHGSVLDCIAFLSKQRDGEFEVTTYKPKVKRSLNANSYYWVLVDQIAEKMCLPRDEVHRQMLTDYGTWEKNEDGSVKWVIFPENKPLPNDGYYFDTKSIVTVKGQNSGEEIGRVYIVVKGSHEYNSKEMYDLIQGAIMEAKQLDIETRTPAEIDEMIRLIGTDGTNR